MRFYNIIKNNPNWNNNIEYIYINNNICKTTKKLNDILRKDLENGDRNRKSVIEQFQKNNKNYQKILKSIRRKEELTKI